MKTPTTPATHTPTKSDIAMENLAVFDTLEREDFSSAVIDRIVRAVNSHEALLKAAQHMMFTLESQGYTRDSWKAAISQAEEGL